MNPANTENFTSREVDMSVPFVAVLEVPGIEHHELGAPKRTGKPESVVIFQVFAH